MTADQLEQEIWLFTNEAQNILEILNLLTPNQRSEIEQMAKQLLNAN